MAKVIIIQAKTISEADDIELLDKYGFDFEKNIRIYLHDNAEMMRKALNENNKN